MKCRDAAISRIWFLLICKYYSMRFICTLFLTYKFNIYIRRCVFQIIENCRKITKDYTKSVINKEFRILTFCICFSHNMTTSSIWFTISSFFNNISSVIAGSFNSGIFGIVSKISPSTCSNVLNYQNQNYGSISKSRKLKQCEINRVFISFWHKKTSTNHSTLSIRLSR